MTYKSFMTGSVIALALSIAPSLAETKNTGVINFTFDAKHRERLVQSILFYPAEAGGIPEWIGANAVFKGVEVRRDAKPEQHKHPLIIISHGSGGSAGNLAWLAKRLVTEGFTVAIPNHQGSTSADSTPETTIPAVWERPADVSALIDALSVSRSVSAFTNTSDISALGFSLGGQTVLSLAGVEFEAAGLAQHCHENSNSPECIWFAKGDAVISGHVDLTKIDARRFDVSHPDERIRRIIAIDPAFVPSIKMHTLEKVSQKVQIMNLGVGRDIPIGIKADLVAAAIPGARYDTLEGANHFDFIAECKSLSWVFLWMASEDPICAQSANRSRRDIHTEIADKIIKFLKPDRS
ncbi:MAG: alpha/beta hydrolase family protein [Rhizobiaceae bacterium]